MSAVILLLLICLVCNYSIWPPRLGDEAWRLQRVGLLLSDGTRLLFRHRHSPSGGNADRDNRAALEAHLLSCPDGAVIVNVGDFNEDPLCLAVEGLRPVATEELTFRRSAESLVWCSRIDGFRVSDWIDVTSAPMRGVMPSQHALVVVALPLSPASVSHLRWPRLAFAPRPDPPVGHRFLFADALRQFGGFDFG